MATHVAPSQTETLVTGEELLAMGEVGPSELVKGRIIQMSPTSGKHAICEVKFGRYLDTFVTQNKLGRVMGGEVGIYTSRNPDTVRAADVAFISNERYARWKQAGFLDVAPELVVEILSPDDRMTDIMRKLREYFDAGVKLVWVADPETKTVYAYRSMTDVREFGESDKLTGDDVLPGFSVLVASLFEE